MNSVSTDMDESTVALVLNNFLDVLALVQMVKTLFALLKRYLRG